jgi:hypothetical protein
MMSNRYPMTLMNKGLNDDRSMLDSRKSTTFRLVDFGESLSLVAESKSRRVLAQWIVLMNRWAGFAIVSSRSVYRCAVWLRRLGCSTEGRKNE